MQLLHHRQRLTGSVGDHVGVGKPVFLEVPVEDLDLQLESGRIRRSPKNGLLLTDARLSQAGVADAGEMESTEHVPELVLIPEPLVPVGVKKEMIRSCSRPPRLLEVVIEICVDADEGGRDTSPNGRELALRKRTRWFGWPHHRVVRGR